MEHGLSFHDNSFDQTELIEHHHLLLEYFQNFLIYYRTISGKLDLVENEITAHNKNPTFYDTPARGDFWAVKKNANHIISVLSKS